MDGKPVNSIASGMLNVVTRLRETNIEKGQQEMNGTGKYM